MSRRRGRRARRQRRRIIAASAVVGTALFAFVFGIVTDERWQKGDKDPLVQLPPVDGAEAQTASTRRVRPGTSAAELSVDAVGTEAAYDAGAYNASDYDPLYPGAEGDVFEPESIDWLAPKQTGAAGGFARSGAGVTHNASMNAGSGSGSGGGAAPGGRGGVGGLGLAGAGAGAGSDSGSGDSDQGPASSEQPGERSIFTGLDVAPEPSSADDISRELERLSAPDFASLPPDFDPCSSGGLVVSPCVTPPPGPCPGGDASCGGGESGSGTPDNVASVNGAGTGGESSGSGGGDSGGSGANGSSGENGEGGSTGESGGTGSNGDVPEGVQIASTPSSGPDDGTGGGSNEGENGDERRTPFASSDLRPLLISGGTNPQLTNGDGNEGEGETALVAASSSATVPVPAPALLLAFGLALLARRR